MLRNYAILKYKFRIEKKIVRFIVEECKKNIDNQLTYETFDHADFITIQFP